MGYDVATAEQVREALSGYSGVAERPMIGGLAFLIGGHLVCEVMSELLLVPLDPSRPHPELPSGASGAAVGAVGRGIVRVPLRSLSSKKLLAWVKMGAERASQEAPRDLSKVKGITLAKAHPRKAGKRKKDAVQPKPTVTVPQPAALTARGTGSTLVGVHDERRPQDAEAAAAGHAPLEVTRWEAATPDGRVLVLVRTVAEAHAIAREPRAEGAPELLIWSMEEAARVLSAYGVVNDIKAAFPGAEVVRASGVQMSEGQVHDWAVSDPLYEMIHA